MPAKRAWTCSKRLSAANLAAGFRTRGKQSLTQRAHALPMGGAKRPKLYERGDSSRAGDRAEVRIPGTCIVGQRPPEDFLVTDISARGCKSRLVSIGVTKTEHVVLPLGS